MGSKDFILKFSSNFDSNEAIASNVVLRIELFQSSSDRSNSFLLFSFSSAMGI